RDRRPTASRSRPSISTMPTSRWARASFMRKAASRSISCRSSPCRRATPGSTAFPSPTREPHTQEHLLLGKGTTGRAFASLDTMWLSTSSAFTQQWRTVYHFSTGASKDVFFDLLSAQLNALLHPNYTDEEFRFFVHSSAATENPDGTLRLEE